MRKNKLGIFTISAFLVGLVISGQITSAQINQKETETAVTYTIGYLPITHALPVFEEKELLEAEIVASKSSFRSSAPGPI